MSQQLPSKDENVHVQVDYGSERAFAKKIVEIIGHRNNTLLTKRSRSLYATSIATLVVLIFEILYMIPVLVSRNFTVGASLTAMNAVFQLYVLFYFIRTKDTAMTLLVIKFLLIISSLGLFFGFFGGVPLLIISGFIILQITALGSIRALEN